MQKDGKTGRPGNKASDRMDLQILLANTMNQQMTVIYSGVAQQASEWRVQILHTLQQEESKVHTGIS